MLKKLALTAAVMPILGATAVTISSNENAAKDVKPVVKHRPSELPVYSPIHEDTKKCTGCKHNKVQAPVGGVRGTVEESIGAVRGSVQQVVNTVSSQTHQIDDYIQTGKEHSKGKSKLVFFFLKI